MHHPSVQCPCPECESSRVQGTSNLKLDSQQSVDRQTQLISLPILFSKGEHQTHTTSVDTAKTCNNIESAFKQDTTIDTHTNLQIDNYTSHFDQHTNSTLYNTVTSGQNTYHTSSSPGINYHPELNITNPSLSPSPTPISHTPPLSLKTADDTTVHIYTDGSYKDTSLCAGWGVNIMRDSTTLVELYGPVITNAHSCYSFGANTHTNNTAELQAIGEALLWCVAHPNQKSVHIHTDSTYAIKSITGSYTPKNNKQCILTIQKLYQHVHTARHLQLSYVKAHSNDPGNERADALANKGRKGESSVLTSCPEKIRKSTLETPAFISSQDSPLRIHSLPPTDPRVQPAEYLARYCSTSIPLSPHEMYEWSASQNSVPELDKIAKHKFLQLNLHQQMEIIHHQGHNLTNMNQGIDLILGNYQHLLKGSTLPHPLSEVHNLPIHRLIYIKHLTRLKIDYIKEQQKKAIRKLSNYHHQNHADMPYLLKHIDTQSHNLSNHIKLSQITVKKLRTRLSALQSCRQGLLTTTILNLPDLAWHKTIQCLFAPTTATNQNKVTLTIPTTSHPPVSIPCLKQTETDKTLSDMSIYSELEITSSSINVPQHTSVHHQLFTTATININQLTPEKAHLLAIIMRQQQIDIMSVIDVRLPSRPVRWCKRIIHAILGPGSQIHYNSAKVKHRSNVTHPGGILLILSPRLSGFPATFTDDPTGLGIYTHCNIELQTQKIQLIATYWPCIHTPQQLKKLPGSLHALLLDWMHRRRIFQDPLQFIQQEIITKTTTETGKSCTTIIGGDFNYKWTEMKNNTSKQSLRVWARDNKFSNPIVDQSLLFNNSLATYHHPSAESTTATIIDHLLYKSSPSIMQPQQASLIHGELWQQYSDHNIVILQLGMNHPLTRPIPAKDRQKHIPKLDLQLDRKSQVLSYQLGFQEWLRNIPTDCNPVHLLDLLTKKSVSITSSLQTRRKHRSQTLHKPSKEYTIYQAALAMIVEFKQHMEGTNRKKKISTKADYANIITATWHKHVNQTTKKTGLSPTDVYTAIATNCPTLEQWLLHEAPEATDTVITLCHTIIKKVHIILNKIRRNHQHQEYQKYRSQREHLREIGRLKTVINSIIGEVRTKKRHHISLDTIRNPDGSLEIIPKKIHKLITDAFNAWYQIPPTSSSIHVPPSGSTILTHATNILQDPEYLKALATGTGVPDKYIDLFHQAITPTITSPIQTQMATSLNTPPTMAEFESQIKRISRDSTPGPSGLTYNMIKAWPSEVVSAAHSALTEIWERKMIPESWKWRWIVAIPKKSDPHPLLADLRPITLVEALRKVWLAIINKKIQVVWTEYNLLHQSQHGSRQQRGTYSASLIHIHHLESIMEQHGRLHRSSWDMKRAFDSVSKTFICIAWIRMGVPPEIAEWLVEIDESNTTIIKTPHATAKWDKQPYKNIHIIDDTPGSTNPTTLPAFTARRGTGQGDVVSPNVWIAFLDILLHMLDKGNPSPTVTFGEGGNPRPAYDIAYVDDMESITTTNKEMQVKAEIVAAFCILTELELSTPKLRRFYQDETDNGDWDEVQAMIIRRIGWATTEVKVRVDGTTTYLGIQYDITRHYSITQHTENLQLLRQLINSLITSKASSGTKLAVLLTSIYPTIIYKAKMCALSFDQYQQYDKLVYPALLNITKNRTGFPYALLHLSPQYGGIGIPALSQQIQLEKLCILQRSLCANADAPHHIAARDILHQAATEHNNNASPRSGEAATLPHPDWDRKPTQPTTWIDSLLQWMHTYDMTFVKHGEQIPKTDEYKYLQQGQLWINPPTYKTSYISEIVGWNQHSSQIHVKAWNISSDNTIFNIRSDTATPIPYSQLFPSPTLALPARVQHKVLGSTPTERRAFLLSTGPPSQVPDYIVLPTPTFIVQLCQTLHLHTHLHLNTMVYTIPAPPQLQHAFTQPQEQSKSISTVIILITSIPPHSSTPLQHLIQYQDCQTLGCTTTNELELLAATLALHYATLLPQRPYVVTPNPIVHAQLLTTRNLKYTTTSKAFWLKQSASTSLMKGIKVMKLPLPLHQTDHNSRQEHIKIYLRDITQPNPPSSPLTNNSKCTIQKIPSTLIPTHLHPNHTWIVYQHGNPIFKPLEEANIQLQYHQYTTCRDAYHPNNPQWSQSTPYLIKRVFNMNELQKHKRSHLTRIIFDWGYHGRNQLKGKVKPTNNNCDICHQEPDSNTHWICRCTELTSAMFRKDAINKLQSTLQASQQKYNKLVEQIHPDPEAYAKNINQQNVDITVGTYFLSHATDSEIGARLWTANWNTSMTYALCKTIILPTDDHNLQFTPQYMVNQLRRSILQYSSILAKYLLNIWTAKARHIQQTHSKQIQSSGIQTENQQDTPHNSSQPSEHDQHTSTSTTIIPSYTVPISRHRKDARACLNAVLREFYHIHEVPGDGNCMFTAIAHQLQQVQNIQHTASELRHTINQWLLSNPDYIIPITFQPITDTRETHRHILWEEYCTLMLQTGVYGEAPHLWATSRIYNVTIHIFNPIGQQILPSVQSSPQHIYLAHYDPVQHYSSLCLKENVTHPLQQPIVQTHNSHPLHISPSTVNDHQPTTNTTHSEPPNRAQIVDNSQTSNNPLYVKPTSTSNPTPSSIQHSISGDSIASTHDPTTAIRRSTRIRTTVQTYNETYLANIQEGISFSITPNQIRHQHPTDTHANKYMYIADTSLPGVQGLGCFATKSIPRGTTIAYYHGGPVITHSTKHKFTLSTYTFEDKKHPYIIDPYNPEDQSVACAGARINDHIQNPQYLNCEFKANKKNIKIVTTREIEENEEFFIPYSAFYWKDQSFPLNLIQAAQTAYHMEDDNEWNQLIQAKVAEATNLVTEHSRDTLHLHPSDEDSPESEAVLQQSSIHSVHQITAEDIHLEHVDLQNSPPPQITITINKTQVIIYPKVTELITTLHQRPPIPPYHYYQTWAEDQLINLNPETDVFLLDKLNNMANQSYNTNDVDVQQMNEAFSISEMRVLLPQHVGILNGCTDEDPYTNNQELKLECITTLPHLQLILREQKFYIHHSTNSGYYQGTPLTDAQIATILDSTSPLTTFPLSPGIPQSANQKTFNTHTVFKLKRAKTAKPKYNAYSVYQQLKRNPNINVKARLTHQLRIRQLRLRDKQLPPPILPPSWRHIFPQLLSPTSKKTTPTKPSPSRRRIFSLLSSPKAKRINTTTSRIHNSSQLSSPKAQRKKPPRKLTHTRNDIHQELSTSKNGYIPLIVIKPKKSKPTKTTFKPYRQPIHLLLQQQPADSSIRPTNTSIAEKYQLPNPYPPRTKSWYIRYDNSEAHTTLFTKFRIPITKEKLQCLNPHQQLNDEIINYFIHRLQGKHSKYKFFNTYFLTNLLDIHADTHYRRPVNYNNYNYERVRRWTRNINIFSLERIYFIWNIDNCHWITIEIRIDLQRIQIYDSLYSTETKNKVYNIIVQWISDEARRLHLHIPDYRRWCVEIDNTSNPQQRGTTDCGVYATIFQHLLSNNLPITIEHQDIHGIREILQHTILEDGMDHDTNTIDEEEEKEDEEERTLEGPS